MPQIEVVNWLIAFAAITQAVSAIFIARLTSKLTNATASYADETKRMVDFLAQGPTRESERDSRAAAIRLRETLVGMSFVGRAQRHVNALNETWERSFSLEKVYLRDEQLGERVHWFTQRLACASRSQLSDLTLTRALRDLNDRAVQLAQTLEAYARGQDLPANPFDQEPCPEHYPQHEIIAAVERAQSGSEGE